MSKITIVSINYKYVIYETVLWVLKRYTFQTAFLKIIIYTKIPINLHVVHR